jgi:hypothetical protein
VTVAREIELKDNFENMGAQMIRAVASKAQDHAGDGTTTATVLAQAIVREGMKSVSAGVDPMDLKRGINIAVGAVVRDIAGSAQGGQSVARTQILTGRGKRRPIITNAPNLEVAGRGPWPFQCEIQRDLPCSAGPWRKDRQG